MQVTINSDEVHFRDLFLWAVLVGNMRLTRPLWEQTSQPLHAALLGAYVHRVLAQYTIGQVTVPPQPAYAHMAGTDPPGVSQPKRRLDVQPVNGLTFTLRARALTFL